MADSERSTGHPGAHDPGLSHRLHASRQTRWTTGKARRAIGPEAEATDDAEGDRRLAEEDAKTDRLASEKAETIEALALKLDHFLMRVEKYDPSEGMLEDDLRDRRLLRSVVSDAHRLSATLKPRRPDPETDPVCRVRDALASSAPICEAMASAADHARQAAHLSGQRGKSPITEGTIEWLWRLSADLSAHAEALDEYDMSRGRAE